MKIDSKLAQKLLSEGKVKPSLHSHSTKDKVKSLPKLKRVIAE